MRGMKGAVVVAALLLGTAGTAAAQSATQTVAFAVSAINELSVSGSPSLTVNTATAGSQPNVATDATSTYAITTNETAKKITAAIDAAMPANVTLSVTVTAPSTGVSAGKVALGTTAVDVVNSVDQVAESGLGMTYELAATVAAGTVTGSRVVTYTITTGP